MRVLLVSGNRDHWPSPVVPLGVISIAGAIREEHETKLCDLCFVDDPEAALVQAIEEFRPDVIGIGMRNLDSNAYNAQGAEILAAYYQGLVQAAKKVTSAPIVMGGSGFSLQPQRLLERFGADYGVVGEGERAFREVLSALARGEVPPRVVRGENVLANNEGLLRVQLRKSATIMSDLDLLPPPARDLVDHRYYEFDGTENIQTKRGCAFGCTYCDYPDLEGRKVRARDPQRVADEVLERSKIPGIGYGYFVDSVFNVPPKHALAICKALIDRGSPMPWCCYGTPAAFDDELVAAMVEAGCQGVEVGTDSGTDRMLKLLKKPFKLADVVKTRELFLKHGLLDSHTFVLGAEDETAEEVRASLQFIRELNPDIAVLVVFTEERETRAIARAKHREDILRVLGEEAPSQPGWIVAELGIRFGGKAVPGEGVGPAWVRYARKRREKLLAGRIAAAT